MSRTTPDLLDLIDLRIAQGLSQLHTAMPGEIVAYNPNKQVADIKPLVRDFLGVSNGTNVVMDVPILYQVPVLFPRAGDYFISMPLQKGHKVLVLFNEKSISNYFTGDGNSVTDPLELERHSLDDAVCLAGFYPLSYPLKGAETNAIVLGKSGNAQEPVAMADKVLEELEALRQAVSDLASNVALHTHPVSVAGPLVGATTGIVITPTTIPTMQAVGSKSVKVTE